MRKGTVWNKYWLEFKVFKEKTTLVTLVWCIPVGVASWKDVTVYFTDTKWVHKDRKLQTILLSYEQVEASALHGSLLPSVYCRCMNGWMKGQSVRCFNKSMSMVTLFYRYWNVGVEQAISLAGSCRPLYVELKLSASKMCDRVCTQLWWVRQVKVQPKSWLKLATLYKKFYFILLFCDLAPQFL